MPLKHELSVLVKRRLDEMGVTPERLAELARVPPMVVDALLTVGEPVITVADAESIANAVGLSLGVFGHRDSRENRASAFSFAALTSSTSYRTVVSGDAIRDALRKGVVLADYRPHFRTLLDEAPVGLLARLADELNQEAGVPQSETWQVMRKVAAELGCSRDLWN
jgi:hypothetical protein